MQQRIGADLHTVSAFLDSLFVLPGSIEHSVNLIHECRDRQHLACVILLLRTLDVQLHLFVCAVLPDNQVSLEAQGSGSPSIFD